MTASSLLADLSRAIEDLAAAAAPSVVEVASHRSLSSGFVWREGLIVTAEEALADEGDVAIEFADGTQHRVTIVGRDPSTDIALLRIEGVATKPATLSTALPRPGALVTVAGAAESAPLVAFGHIAAVGPAWRSMRGGRIDARIELDLKLRRRAQGAPALDAHGSAIGMAVRGPRGVTLVIPAATIERIAPLLLAHGKVPRGYLGLGLKDVAVANVGPGAMVMSVAPGGPAATAGILQGDVIVRWDGEPVRSVVHLIRTLDHVSIGRSIPLTVLRGGRDMEASITIGSRPPG